MSSARELTALALAERAKAGIKVRQPLAKLEVPKEQFQKISKDLLELVKDELNVKEVRPGDVLRLDTSLTQELREEGWMRELVRNTQEMRRDLGLRHVHKIRLQVIADIEMSGVLGRWKEWLIREAGAKEFLLGGKKIFRAERELSLDGHELWVGIEKT